MRIAIPTANGKLAMHFGHCEKFTIVDTENETIIKKEELVPPPHEPGVLPKWLKEQNVEAIIAGGMGQRAQELFNNAEIKVTVGAPAEDIDDLIVKYLNNTLESGANCCDH
jgi:predicted Fe-Mo cluster-binding NifX family protein